MKHEVKKQSKRARQQASRRSSLLAWTVGAGVIALLVYGATQVSTVAYDEDDLGVINFSELNADQKQNALETANSARCTCSCGMTLAQCVSTDSTCPVRETNIQKIKTMVADAKQAG